MVISFRTRVASLVRRCDRDHRIPTLLGRAKGNFDDRIGLPVLKTLGNLLAFVYIRKGNDMKVSSFARVPILLTKSGNNHGIADGTKSAFKRSKILLISKVFQVII